MDTYPSLRHFHFAHFRPMIHGYPPFFSPFFPFLCCRLSLLLCDVTPSDKNSHYSSLDFLSSLVPGVVEWIDHNSVSSLPTRNLIPCWAVFVPFHIFRAAIPTSKKTFNNCQYFRSISSGCWRKPKYILVVKIFTSFFFLHSNLQTPHHGIYLVLLLIIIICIIEKLGNLGFVH